MRESAPSMIVENSPLGEGKNEASVLPLVTTFTFGAFLYTQVWRDQDHAIYRQQHKASGICRYEVITIRVQPAHTWPNGRTVPAHEAYPPATMWGRLGWTVYTEEAARRQVARLQAVAVAKE